MKTIYTIALALFTSTTFAQIPNGGFESWTSMGTYENPDSWGTLNNTTALASVYTATKASPGSVGSFYMKLTSKTVGPSVVNGIAVSGKVDTLTGMPISGFPYAIRSAMLAGKFQHMIYGSSQGGITILMTEWNTTLNKRDTVGMGNLNLTGMAMSWTNFSIPINYATGNNPDSCIIFLRASGSAPTNNDYLWVDGLSFSGTVLGEEDNSILATNFTVYPNPVNALMNISFESTESQVMDLILTDISGKIVLTKNLGNVKGIKNETISTQSLAKGTYILKLSSPKGNQSSKIIIE